MEGGSYTSLGQYKIPAIKRLLGEIQLKLLQIYPAHQELYPCSQLVVQGGQRFWKVPSPASGIDGRGPKSAARVAEVPEPELCQAPNPNPH